VKASSLRPSAGFLLLVVSCSLLIATLVWGLSTPELERVWLIMQGMQRSGFRSLMAEDVKRLEVALTHYPTLPRAFIGRASVGFIEPTHEGWINLAQPHIIRSGLSANKITLDIECQAAASSYPITIALENNAGRRELRFTANGHQSLELQLAQPAAPEIIPVTITSAPGSREKDGARIKLSAPGLPGHKVSS